MTDILLCECGHEEMAHMGVTNNPCTIHDCGCKAYRQSDPNRFVDYSEGQHLRIDMTKVSLMRAWTKSGVAHVEIVVDGILVELLRGVAVRFQEVFGQFEIVEQRAHRVGTRSVVLTPDDG